MFAMKSIQKDQSIALELVVFGIKNILRGTRKMGTKIMDDYVTVKEFRRGIKYLFYWIFITSLTVLMSTLAIIIVVYEIKI